MLVIYLKKDLSQGLFDNSFAVVTDQKTNGTRVKRITDHEHGFACFVPLEIILIDGGENEIF
jgi:hypothetical protein